MYQHIGSRFTQVGDEDLGTLNLLSFEPNTIGGPLTATVFTYDPELPAYDLLNLRTGVRRSQWDVSLYLNNVTNERALLALDQERGTRARIGYLTNQPRSFGISTRFDFSNRSQPLAFRRERYWLVKSSHENPRRCCLPAAHRLQAYGGADPRHP